MRWRSPGSLGSKRLPRTWWLESWRKNLNRKWLHGRNTRKRRRKEGKRERRRKRQKRSKFSYLTWTLTKFIVRSLLVFLFIFVVSLPVSHLCLCLCPRYTPCTLVWFTFYFITDYLFIHMFCVSLCVSSIVSFCLSVVSLSVCPIPMPVPVSPSVCPVPVLLPVSVCFSVSLVSVFPSASDPVWVWVYVNFFTRKWTKLENTQSPLFWYDTCTKH